MVPRRVEPDHAASRLTFFDAWDPVDRGVGAGVIRLLPSGGAPLLAEVFAATLSSGT